MSRAFDIHIHRLNNIKWDYNDDITTKDERDKQLIFHRAEFLARRPQVLMTNKNGTLIKVIKANKSLPRPGICPELIVCNYCKQYEKLNIDRLIDEIDDNIGLYGKE